MGSKGGFDVGCLCANMDVFSGALSRLKLVEAHPMPLLVSHRQKPRLGDVRTYQTLFQRHLKCIMRDHYLRVFSKIQPQL